MGEFTVTPILAILMVVGAALVLVILIIGVYFCFRRRPRPPGGSKARRANSRLSNYTTDTHIPLQKGIDDCALNGNGNGVAETSALTASSSVVITPMTTLSHSASGVSNPDLIPVQAARGQLHPSILYP